MVNAVTGTTRTVTNTSELGLPIPQEVRTTALEITAATRSINDGLQCSMTFVNQRLHPVDVSWFKPSGEKVKYATLLPGKTHEQRTFEGHLWQVDDPSGTVIARFPADLIRTQIIIDGPPNGESHPTAIPSHSRLPRGRSPDQMWQAELAGQTIKLRNLENNSIFQLTAPAEKEAEFHGDIEWSPRSDAFVVSLTVPVTTRQITIGRSLLGDHSESNVRTINYPKAGDPLPQPIPVLFRWNGQEFEARVIDQTLFPNQFSESRSHRYTWEKEGREFYFDDNQRGHQCYRVLAVDVQTGQVRPVIEETAKTFIDYRKKSWKYWLSTSHAVLWLSERSGWCHLYRYDVSGQSPPLQLTDGNWVVREVKHVDETLGMVWFTASGLRSGEDPYHVHLCQVRLDGTGFQQLTAGDGEHEIQFSPDHTLFLDTWSRVDRVPVTELRQSLDGRLICEVAPADESALANFAPLPERFAAKGRDGLTEIYGIIIKPSNFDPARTYPIVEDLYAGPHGAFCPRTFGTHSRLQGLADLGFVVVKADGMGTNFRGKAFHDVCWKNLKDSGFPDRIAWIKAAAQTRPWMDLSRVGVIGGSAGGQSAMRALLDHSDFYHVAVADCGCHDNRIDKLWWNEQWMGWPVDESYSKSSNVDDAGKLQGHLLLIVGEADSNVDPDSTMQVVNALKECGKEFDFFPIADTGHGAAGTPAGTQRQNEFLIRHLKPADSH